MTRTHSALALMAVNTIGRDIVLMSTCQLPSDWGARLVAGALADWFAEEARLYRRLWPEAADRAETAAEELGLIAVYEDAETVAAHREDMAAYEARGNYKYAARG